MKNRLLFASFLMLLAGVETQLLGQRTNKTGDGLHRTWDTLLKKHVTQEGWVSYRDFKKDEAILDYYLRSLANNPPSEVASKNAKLAYYINLYNAGTVKLILNHYPLNSIKEISNPWGKAFLKVGQKTISLEEIEHVILRKMGEPRIHFAINCASISCPRLLNQAYTSQNIELQLQNVTKSFILNQEKNKIDAEDWKLSKIFKWFSADFNSYGGVIAFINQYLQAPIHKPRVTYTTYDWGLNGN